MLKITLNRESEKTLYAQLKEAIIKTIKRNILKTGDKLPPIVSLAKELGITQATVLRAFSELTKEGYIVSFVGRGTFVTDPINWATKTIADTKIPATRFPLEPANPEFALAARRLRMGIANSLNSLNILTNRPGLIRFTAGIPDPKIAEPDILAKCGQKALKKGQSLYAGYGDGMGTPELRAVIAQRMNATGLNITPEQILITSGTQQAISILAQSALENNQRILCETPCYMGIPNAFGAIGHWVESVPRDENGPIMDRLLHNSEPRPSMFYICTELHNPMGTDLAEERKKQIVEWAVNTGSIVVGDEIFHDLRFEGETPPSIFRETDGQQTMTVSSISKSFMCGLRVGWLIADESHIRNLLGLKRAMDIGCPPLMQGIALELLASGAYDEHIKKAQRVYKERRDATIQALTKFMPQGIRWTNPKGGFHMWVELPSGYSSIALFLLAIERGVAINPGPHLDVDHRFINAFKLSYGSLEPTQIHEGVPILADAVKELLRQEPSNPGMSGLGGFL